MNKAWTLAACVAIVAGVAPRASAQFDPFGRPQFRHPGAAGPLPGGGNPLAQPVVPGAPFGPAGHPVNPWDDRKERDRGLGLGGIPHIPHVPVPEFRPAPELKPVPEVRFTPPAFEAPQAGTAFRAASVSEFRPVGGRLGVGGGGLLAGIGGAIAGLFRALFGRKNDRGNA
jgi:hypothetical protein